MQLEFEQVCYMQDSPKDKRHTTSVVLLRRVRNEYGNAVFTKLNCTNLGKCHAQTARQSNSQQSV